MARTTNLTITLYMSELIYDVQNKSYLTGRSRQNGNNHEEVANMQANDDDEDKNQVLRSIGNAYANLISKLSEFIVSEATTDSNELVSEEQNYEVSLVMPSNYNKATSNLIASAMHQYIVNTAIADWFTITNKADAADYLNLASANLQQIREATNKRIRPERTAIE